MICNNCGANLSDLDNSICKFCGNSIENPKAEQNKKINSLLDLVENNYFSSQRNFKLIKEQAEKLLHIDSEFGVAWVIIGLSDVQINGNTSGIKNISKGFSLIKDQVLRTKYYNELQRVIIHQSTFWTNNLNNVQPNALLSSPEVDFEKYISLDFELLNLLPLIDNSYNFSTHIEVLKILKSAKQKVVKIYIIQLESILLNNNISVEVHDEPKKGCFIATATMGDYNHPIVLDLRIFRDNWLLKRTWGMKFTNWYYKNSPTVARFIEHNVMLRNLTLYILIKPLHFITKRIK
jgi:hypothetical protein